MRKYVFCLVKNLRSTTKFLWFVTPEYMRASLRLRYPIQCSYLANMKLGVLQQPIQHRECCLVAKLQTQGNPFKLPSLQLYKTSFPNSQQSADISVLGTKTVRAVQRILAPSCCCWSRDTQFLTPSINCPFSLKGPRGHIPTFLD